MFDYLSRFCRTNTVLPNLFWFAAPLLTKLLLKITCGTPNGFIRYKDQGIVYIGGTLGTISRHPGWEPLIQTREIRSIDKNVQLLFSFHCKSIFLNDVDQGFSTEVCFFQVYRLTYT